MNRRFGDPRKLKSHWTPQIQNNDLTRNTTLCIQLRGKYNFAAAMFLESVIILRVLVSRDLTSQKVV